MIKSEPKYYEGTTSHFEIFLKHSNQKEKSAEVLGALLKQYIKPNCNLLDIGAGNGEFLSLSLQKGKVKSPVNFCFIEPSKQYVSKLRQLNLARNSKAVVFNGTWEQYKTSDKFDIILAAHYIYHTPRENWPKAFQKMWRLLNPGGYFIFVVRMKDDAYKFKNKFKPLFLGGKFKAVTLEECLPIIKKITKKSQIRIYNVHSKLYFPHNQMHRIKLIEFYLNQNWQEISNPIKNKITNYIAQRQYSLNLVDGVIVLKKT